MKLIDNRLPKDRVEFKTLKKGSVFVIGVDSFYLVLDSSAKAFPHNAINLRNFIPYVFKPEDLVLPIKAELTLLSMDKEESK